MIDYVLGREARGGSVRAEIHAVQLQFREDQIRRLGRNRERQMEVGPSFRNIRRASHWNVQEGINARLGAFPRRPRECCWSRRGNDCAHNRALGLTSADVAELRVFMGPPALRGRR